MQIYKRIRALGGYSLILAIPAEIKHAFELSAGDEVSFEMEGDGVKLKFYETKKKKILVEKLVVEEHVEGP
jgi:bifunctional DNA-binding transcriptional regulator/antitoxin component of YhaV-PrlF toxin-antitoxin module